MAAITTANDSLYLIKLGEVETACKIWTLIVPRAQAFGSATLGTWGGK